MWSSWSLLAVEVVVLSLAVVEALEDCWLALRV
jgi:hypothetical protein